MIEKDDRLTASLRFSYLRDSSDHRDEVFELRSRLRKALWVVAALPFVAAGLTLLSAIQSADLSARRQREDMLCWAGIDCSSLVPSGFGESRYQTLSGDLARADAELLRKAAGFVGCLIVTLLSVVNVARGRRRGPVAFEKAVQDGRFQVAADSAAFFIRADVAELQEEMEIYEGIVLWYDAASFEVAGSILRRDKVFHLVMSEGLVALHSRDPQSARALLAHELAHVLQNDSDLIWLAESFGGRMAKLSRYTFWALIVFSAIAQSSIILPVVATFAFIRKLPTYVIEARQRSELLADAAALAFVGPAAVHVLSEVLHEDSATNVHLPRNERIRALSIRLREEREATHAS